MTILVPLVLVAAAGVIIWAEVKGDESERGKELGVLVVIASASLSIFD